MFRSQAPRLFRRSFSLFRRSNNSSIAQTGARDGHDTIQIQRVYFKKRVFTTSRIIGGTIVAVGAYALLSWVDDVLDDIDLEEEEEAAKAARLKRRGDGINGEAGADNEEDEEEDEDDDEDDEDDEEEGYEDEEGLFFFPTGLPRPKPQTYYKGSDPEWQEFIKFAKDRQKLAAVRGRLVALVRGMVVNNPKYVMVLGEINLKKGNHWIDFRFPDGPPIEYERPGYELTDELNFRKTTRDIHPADRQLMEKLIYPSAVANAVYLDSKRKTTLLWQDFRQYMGWTEPTPEPAQKLLTQQPFVHPLSPKPSPPFTASDSSTPAPPAPNRADPDKPPSSPGPLSNSATERFGITLPDPTKVPMLDLRYFRQRLYIHRMQNIAKIPPIPPRGAFIVSGLIEVVGERRKMTLDVTACFDPKINDFVRLNVKLRHVVDRVQRPKGGP